MRNNMNRLMEDIETLNLSVLMLKYYVKMANDNGALTGRVYEALIKFAEDAEQDLRNIKKAILQEVLDDIEVEHFDGHSA